MSDQRTDRAQRELGMVLRFGVVGVAATAVHSASVWLLHTAAALSIFAANLLAFMLAFQVSFFGHARWTFASSRPDQRAARWRFLLVSGTGFLFNTTLLALLLKLDWLAPQHAGAAAALAVPAWSFILSRLWAFRPFVA